MKLELKKIRTDGRTQPREVLNEDVITEYAEAMRRGDKFPMVDVFYDGTDYWLADGFHRANAARRANLKKIGSSPKSVAVAGAERRNHL